MYKQSAWLIIAVIISFWIYRKKSLVHFGWHFGWHFQFSFPSRSLQYLDFAGEFFVDLKVKDSSGKLRVIRCTCLILHDNILFRSLSLSLWHVVSGKCNILFRLYKLKGGEIICCTVPINNMLSCSICCHVVSVAPPFSKSRTLTTWHIHEEIICCTCLVRHHDMCKQSRTKL
jgi:hypothetical protein